MKVQWLGHAAVKLSGGGAVVYIDPSVMPYLGKKARDVMETVEPADLILVTHEHADHCSTDTIERLKKPGTVIVAPASCEEKLGSVFWSMDAGDEAAFGNVHVRAVEAYNVVRHRTPGTPFHPRGTGIG
ncbi:MAG: MBL fold metallo-hydrolase, partial [Chloroflexota bacterium]